MSAFSFLAVSLCPVGTRLGADGLTDWFLNYDDKKWIGQKKGFLARVQSTKPTILLRFGLNFRDFLFLHQTTAALITLLITARMSYEL